MLTATVRALGVGAGGVVTCGEEGAVGVELPPPLQLHIASAATMATHAREQSKARIVSYLLDDRFAAQEDSSQSRCQLAAPVKSTRCAGARLHLT
jgi:hypothetical protein